MTHSTKRGSKLSSKMSNYILAALKSSYGLIMLDDKSLFAKDSFFWEKIFTSHFYGTKIFLAFYSSSSIRLLFSTLASLFFYFWRSLANKFSIKFFYSFKSFIASSSFFETCHSFYWFFLTSSWASFKNELYLILSLCYSYLAYHNLYFNYVNSSSRSSDSDCGSTNFVYKCSSSLYLSSFNSISSPWRYFWWHLLAWSLANCSWSISKSSLYRYKMCGHQFIAKVWSSYIIISGSILNKGNFKSLYINP